MLLTGVAVLVITVVSFVILFYYSETLHGSKLDKIYGRIFTTRCFTKGWGKPEDFKRLFAFWKLVTNRESCFKLVARDHPVVIVKEEVHQDCKILNGEFVSPFVNHVPGLLPKETEIAYFQVVLPNSWKSEHYKPVCLHLAGTGDDGYGKRTRMFAKPLAKSEGIGAVLLENPFYGQRKPNEQIGCNIHNVTDLFAMAACVVVESMVILHWCERNGYGPLGLSGLSMGGHMASFAAASWPKPVVLVPCLSASTATPIFTEGVMSKLINWNLLKTQYLADEAYKNEIGTLFRKQEDEGENVQQSSQDASIDREVTNFMRGIMEECTNLKHFDMPVDPQLVIAVCAMDDGYVPCGTFTPWNELWPGAEMQTVNAGHVSSYILHQSTFRKTIVDCFDRMKKKYCES